MVICVLSETASIWILGLFPKACFVRSLTYMYTATWHHAVQHGCSNTIYRAMFAVPFLCRYCWCAGSPQNAGSSTAGGRAGCRNYGLSPNTAASQPCSPVCDKCHTDPSGGTGARGRMEKNKHNQFEHRVLHIPGFNGQHCTVQQVASPHSRGQWTGTCSGVDRTPPACLRSDCAASSGWCRSSRRTGATDDPCCEMSGPAWKAAYSLEQRKGRTLFYLLSSTETRIAMYT